MDKLLTQGATRPAAAEKRFIAVERFLANLAVPGLNAQQHRLPVSTALSDTHTIKYSEGARREARGEKHPNPQMECLHCSLARLPSWRCVYALCSRERSVRTLAGARLLSNVRYEAARERYCCGRGYIEGVLRPAPNTVSHESARNAARGHLYRAFGAADTVERESPVSLDDCAHSWTSGYGHM